MAQFSKQSLERLATCHPDIVKICNLVIHEYDFTVLEGSRSDLLQQKYFKEGKSKLDGINKRSKHQVTKLEPLSMAIDISPYPVDFSNNHKKLARFYQLSGFMFMASKFLYDIGEIKHLLRWGGDWNSNFSFDDNSFDDLPHFELVKV